MCRAWSIAFVLACGSSKQTAPAPANEPPKAAAPAPAPVATGTPCADRAARLDKRLHELVAATPGFMPIAHDVNPPESKAAKPLDARGYVVAVTHDGKLLYRGQLIASMNDLGEHLDVDNKQALEKLAMAGGSIRDAHFPLYVWADRDAPAGTIANIVATAKKMGHFEPRLLVAGTTEPPRDAALPPEVDAIAAKLPTTEPDATKYLADQLRSAIGECKPLIMTMSTSALEGEPARQDDKLLKELPAGLTECGCKIPNPDVLEWSLHQWFGAWAPALAWIDMPKLAAGDKQPLAKLVAK